MIGLFYLLWAGVSHIGAKTREIKHDLNAPVNPYTNTYMDFYGKQRDANTHEYRHYTTLSNGDRVLLNKKHEVVRNMSMEERNAGYREAARDKERDPELVTAYKTNEHRLVVYDSPCYRGMQVTLKGTIYKDLKNGKEYYEMVVKGNGRTPNKRFYVDVNNPFDLVRMSDTQRQSEKYRLLQNTNLEDNWLLHPEKEKAFIEEYNSRPFVNSSPAEYGRPLKVHNLSTVIF